VKGHSSSSTLSPICSSLYDRAALSFLKSYFLCPFWIRPAIEIPIKLSEDFSETEEELLCIFHRHLTTNLETLIEVSFWISHFFASIPLKEKQSPPDLVCPKSPPLGTVPKVPFLSLPSGWPFFLDAKIALVPTGIRFLISQPSPANG
jgi:hypothetical protein